MNPIFTDKALNNILWHRRALWILALPGLGRYSVYNKKKHAIKARRGRYRDVKGGCYLVHVHPNNYRPPRIIK